MTDLNPSPLELAASLCFLFALLHSFSVSAFQRWAKKTSPDSALHGFLHFLGEVEIVFGIWAAVLVGFIAFHQDFHSSVQFLEGIEFSEAIFVFAIMTIASSKPILLAADYGIEFLSRIFPFHPTARLYFVTLMLGPLLGSLITEPAAMTVSALILKNRVLNFTATRKLLYSTLAVLFVNVSIGGTLTSFAAPPILMVARTWNWNTETVFQLFGFKAMIAVVVNAALVTLFNMSALKSIEGVNPSRQSKMNAPLAFVHFGFLAIAILTSHHPSFLMGSFLFFLGVTEATKNHQSPLKLKESLLVAFFLGGLVVLTSLQAWWLKPLLTSMSELTLYIGAAALTAVTDNAALTSLAAQVEVLSDLSKFAVVAGAVVGGGLTIIANAPNPAGFAILRDRFQNQMLEPLTLIRFALIPTLIAGVCFWIL